MNSFYEACYLYRRREYQQCVDLCSTFLSKNPLDQVISIRITYLGSTFSMKRFILE